MVRAMIPSSHHMDRVYPERVGERQREAKAAIKKRRKERVRAQDAARNNGRMANGSSHAVSPVPSSEQGAKP